MAEQVVYALFSVEADTAEDAKQQVIASHPNAVVVAASSLRELAHPVHLAESQAAFGHIAPAPVEEPVAEPEPAAEPADG